MNINKIGIIGAGVMGAGIAQMFAEHGREVVLWDAMPGMLKRGLAQIKQRLEKSAEKGTFSKDEVPRILARITVAKALADFSIAGLVIEAVVENLEVKQKLFAGLEEVVARTAILATNTSSLGICEIASALKNNERFLGVHFFNPPTKLELVEVVPHEHTTPDIVAAVKELVTACGKTPVTVRDAPGFIVNRLLLLMINEAARMVDEGVACPADIDTAMRLGALHPAGPLAVADLVGLDTCRNILDVLKLRLKRDEYAPANGILERLGTGQLGRKTKTGFFQY